MSAIRWGILGTGFAAQAFASDLRRVPDAVLSAVASRSPERARQFAQRFGVPHACTDGQLLELAEIDVVYVATPNQRHRDDCIAALDSGKAVLCEKPFALSAAQALDVASHARKSGRFCMEAMWMRFLPLMRGLHALVQGGAIGAPRLLFADFGVATAGGQGDRHFTPELGGGALLDLGVYSISLASLLFGPPTSITGSARLGATGVDEDSGIVLGHAGGEIALLGASLRCRTSNEALLVGSAGQLRIHEPFCRPERISVRSLPPPAPHARTAEAGRDGLAGRLRGLHWVQRTMPLLRALVERSTRVLVEPVEGHGLHHEAREVMECLWAGKRESEVMPLDETISILATMDSIRAQWGLRYPTE